ncbi:hypothetical protein HK096_003682 [Nowakowskiella sp. JEL0078]|nr:hypothetical protein HK096_003682 [Nowakowskiella sp. JEL0078]
MDTTEQLQYETIHKFEKFPRESPEESPELPILQSLNLSSSASFSTTSFISSDVKLSDYDNPHLGVVLMNSTEALLDDTSTLSSNQVFNDKLASIDDDEIKKPASKLLMRKPSQDQPYFPEAHSRRASQNIIRRVDLTPITVFEYLLGELNSSDIEDGQDVKKERVQNFLDVPLELEKVTAQESPLQFLTLKIDLMRGALFLGGCASIQYVDSSYLYHMVRGQPYVKLYVVFNVLEARIFVEIKGSVFKRFEKENLFQLSCSDIVERFQLSVFLAIITLCNFTQLADGFTPLFNSVLQTLGDGFSFLITPATWTVFYHLISYPAMDNTAILSVFNNTISINGTENVTHITTDFWSFLGLLKLASPSISGQIISLPSLMLRLVMTIFDSKEYQLLEGLIVPVLVVFATEVVVDWLKHAFITKFNQLRPEVYARFRDSLCRDLVVGSRWVVSKNESSDESELRYIDQSPVVARRIGFVSIPLACLTARIAIQTLDMLNMIPNVFILLHPFGKSNLALLDMLGAKLVMYLCSFVRFVGGFVGQSVQCHGPDVTFPTITSNFWKEFDVLMTVFLIFFGGYLLLFAFKIFLGRSLLRIAQRRVRKLRDEASMKQQQEINLESKSSDSKSSGKRPALAPGQGAGNRNGSDLKLTAEFDEAEIKIRTKIFQKKDNLVVEEMDIILPPEKLDQIDRFQLVKSRVVV